MDIRKELPTDTESIHAVHAISFPSKTEARLVDALREAGHLSISLVCCDQDLLVGHVAFSPVTVNETAVGLGLGPIAVLPQYRRRGIAEKLIRAGFEASSRLGHKFIVVLGDPSYYRRLGFKAASNWGLEDEYGGGRAFQAIELQNCAIPSSGGCVQYAPEFSAAANDGAA